MDKGRVALLTDPRFATQKRSARQSLTPWQFKVQTKIEMPGAQSNSDSKVHTPGLAVPRMTMEEDAQWVCFQVWTQIFSAISE